MKKIFIKDILAKDVFCRDIEILGWIENKREHGAIIFWDVVDSTGKIQVLLIKKNFREKWEKIKNIPSETCVKIIGDRHCFIKERQKNIEVIAKTIEILGEYKLNITPRPRSLFPIFDRKYTNYILKNRSLYLRNPKQMAAISFKSKFLYELNRYFRDNNFVFIESPVLTEMLLYDDDTAFSFNFHGRKVYLTQCCTFQLEAAIIAFEKVYNITPSFRAESSRSNRHLNEYTHLKVELAFANLEDLISLAEDILYNMAKKMVKIGEKELEFLGVKFDLCEFKPSFRRISYDDAVKIFNKEGYRFQYGRNLSEKGVSILNRKLRNKLIWVQYPPRRAEAFPFKAFPHNPNLIMAADLIAPYGFGEIAGVAEKICSKKELLERMTEKGKNTPRQLERYKSYIQLRDAALPPHGGIGMGIDRIVRYFLKLPHVKDVVPYPRLFGHRWNP